MGRHTNWHLDALSLRRPSPPMYIRVLRLKHIQPGGIACFVLLEGSIGVALVLAMAGLASWWGLAVLPVAVAAMVKVNDIAAGLLDDVTGAAPAVRARAGSAAPAADPTGATSAPRRPSRASGGAPPPKHATGDELVAYFTEMHDDAGPDHDVRPSHGARSGHDARPGHGERPDGDARPDVPEQRASAVGGAESAVGDQVGSGAEVRRLHPRRGQRGREGRFKRR